MSDIVQTTPEGPFEATPKTELERQIMDPNTPKMEREWWAASEIAALRARAKELEHLCNDTEAQLLGEAFENAALRAENERLTEELSIWKSVFPDIAPERVLPDRSKLEAENERLRAALRNIIAFHEITFVNDKGLEKAVLRTARAALEERT